MNHVTCNRLILYFYLLDGANLAVMLPGCHGTARLCSVQILDIYRIKVSVLLMDRNWYDRQQMIRELNYWFIYINSCHSPIISTLQWFLLLCHQNFTGVLKIAYSISKSNSNTKLMFLLIKKVTIDLSTD